MQNTEYISPVVVGQSPHHGRGLFAATSFRVDETIGVYPLLILTEEETRTVQQTRLYHYVFYIDETADRGMRAAVAFGHISMCNHSLDANADFTVDAGAQTVTLKANTTIPAGSEILIDYEDFAEEII